MGVIATWGTRKFEINPSRIYPLSGFTTAFKLKSDANADTSGTQPINTRGRELEQITCSTRCLASAGVDVRGEMGIWRGMVGQAYPLMIGGMSFGAGNFQLESVNISETELDMNGTFLAATLSFTFTEYIPANAAATAKATTTSASGKSSSSGTATKSMSEAIAAQKQEALKTKASADDKTKRSPY